MADGDRAAPHLVDVERLEGRADADDVDDRVERADLVQFHVGGIDAVDGALDLAQPFEDGPRPPAHPLGQVGVVEQPQDLAQRPVPSSVVVSS